jgi:hypothetical protein
MADSKYPAHARLGLSPAVDLATWGQENAYLMGMQRALGDHEHSDEHLEALVDEACLESTKIFNQIYYEMNFEKEMK